MTDVEELLRELASSVVVDARLPHDAAGRAWGRARRTRRRWVVARTVGVVVLAVGLVVLLYPPLSNPGTQVRIGPARPVAQLSPSAEALHLLDLAVLPPGSAPTAHGTAHLAGPPTMPAIDGLVDRSRFVTVPLSVDDSLAYLQTHTPTGLQTDSQGGEIGGPGYLVRYDMWEGAGTATYQPAILLISIEATGPSTTVWRLDGQAARPGAPGRRS